MGNFISRGGQRSRVEISDDEDDEVEEINTVSIEISLVQLMHQSLFISHRGSSLRECRTYKVK